MLKWCHTLRKISLSILNIPLDVCILFLDVATVNYLQCIYHICCLPTKPQPRPAIMLRFLPIVLLKMLKNCLL